MEATKPFVHRLIAFMHIIALVVVAAAVFVPKAQAQSGNVYGGGQVQKVSKDDLAIVLQVRIVKSEASATSRTVGAGIGALLGGMLGNSLGYETRFAVNALGATVGGVVGNQVAGAVMSGEAQEITLGFSDPGADQLRIVTVVQPQPFDAVAPEDVVIVSNMNGSVRVRKLDLKTARVQR